jgi:hypothetical protein
MRTCGDSRPSTGSGQVLGCPASEDIFAKARSPEEVAMKSRGFRRPRFCFGAALFVSLLLLCAAPRSSGQESGPSAERQAADKVAEAVQHAREQSKLAELIRIEDPHVRENACARAKNAATSWQMGCGAFARNGVIDCFSYSTSDPSHVEPELLVWAKHESRDPRRFAVGVCATPATENGAERYWIEVNSYMGATKSFFWRTGYTLAHLWSR